MSKEIFFKDKKKSGTTLQTSIYLWMRVTETFFCENNKKDKNENEEEKHMQSMSSMIVIDEIDK